MTDAHDITITPKTTIGTLLKEYPFLKGYLAAYHPEFRKLTNPILRYTMGGMATVDKAAQMACVPLNEFMTDIATAVEKKTGTRPPVADSAAAGGIDPQRLEALKQIIVDLHAGQPMDELTARFAALIEDVEAGEIAAMEQRLIDEGMPATEVKRLCDVHVQVFAEALDEHPAVAAAPGHPIDTFRRENQALLQLLTSLRKVAGAIRAADDSGAAWAQFKPALGGSLERVTEMELHYLRKENQLFPFLEKHGVEGPSKVMWALHDDIRAALKDAMADLERDDAVQAALASEWLAQTAEDMVTKEEKILFPMAAETLSDAEWAEIRAGEGEIGYAFLADVPAWPTRDGAEPAGATAGGPAGLLTVKTGELSLEQLDLILTALPLDFQYVDEHDRVRFYSEGERIFPRSPGVIGRKVQNCHPPASVHKVQQIIDAFRAGEKDAAEFWIEMSGRFLHIRYFALRDAQGGYRGVVETVQDVTEIRALQGQRRLVDW
jgi:DUF438 domain-containing protein